MSASLEIAILSGAGNTFAVLDARAACEFGAPAELARRWRAEPPDGRSQLDGVLLVEPGQAADEVRMIVYNSDGSRPQTCGNGLRCAARFAREHGLVDSDRMRVSSDAGVCDVELLRVEGEIVGARVDMGAPRRIERSVELSGGFGRVAATLVDMGNPHCVVWVDDVESTPVARLGAGLETHARFPERTNVEFIAATPSGLRLRVWERGVGETAACGSGACAAAVVALLEGRARSPLAVESPGGVLRVAWDGGARLWLEGDCSIVSSAVTIAQGALRP